MKYLLFIFITTLQIYGLDFKVATYNVENFFDLHYDKTEYKEYIPNSKYWDKTAYNNKLSNTSKVIKDLDADILALQEIESKRVIDALITKNPTYKYHTFLKNPNSSVGVALLSKFPILNTQQIEVDKYDKYARDILKVTINIENKPFIIYVNHWRSKRAKESKRIIYALALKKEIDKLSKNTDYIILGDLNSNYNEYKTFKYDKNLNDSFNITGINQILNTTINDDFITKETILNHTEKTHFNTWLELPYINRYSSIFKKEHNTPDNILLSQGLFDNSNISYINNSFDVFKTNYLIKNNKIIRWNKYKKTGYSDHLPIYAFFTTSINSIQNNQIKIDTKQDELNSIDTLYQKEQISNYDLKDVVVIYKANDMVIIKHKDAKTNDKAIMIYKPSPPLDLGYIYNLRVDKIDRYFGLKEIKSISNVIRKQNFNNYKKLYIDATKTQNFLDESFINNIITNLEGIYKKNYLYYNDTKVRLYFKKVIKKPEENQRIFISSGHISIYKSSLQITLHKQEDFKID